MDINQIAQMAGVSRATVSRYLNDGYVSQEKREAIRRVIERTGYVPSRQAKTLRTGKTHVVGVIIAAGSRAVMATRWFPRTSELRARVDGTGVAGTLWEMGDGMADTYAE